MTNTVEDRVLRSGVNEGLILCIPRESQQTSLSRALRRIVMLRTIPSTLPTGLLAQGRRKIYCAMIGATWFVRASPSIKCRQTIISRGFATTVTVPFVSAFTCHKKSWLNPPNHFASPRSMVRHKTLEPRLDIEFTNRAQALGSSILKRRSSMTLSCRSRYIPTSTCP